jgi:hypothetical protein
LIGKYDQGVYAKLVITVSHEKERPPTMYQQFRHELRRHYDAAPFHARLFFWIHLPLRVFFALGFVLLLFCVIGSTFHWSMLPFVFAFLVYRRFTKWCRDYRCKREPHLHYVSQKADRGRATFEVLPDGETIPSNAPLVADTLDTPQSAGPCFWLESWLIELLYRPRRHD